MLRVIRNATVVERHAENFPNPVITPPGFPVKNHGSRPVVIDQALQRGHPLFDHALPILRLVDALQFFGHPCSRKRCDVRKEVAGLQTRLLRDAACDPPYGSFTRSEEHTSELQSLMRISYAVFSLKKQNQAYTQRTYSIRNKNNNTL